MWYVSGDEWQIIDGKSMPIYNLKYIESKDGMNWPGNGKTVLELNTKEEHGFGRPFIVDKNETQEMNQRTLGEFIKERRQFRELSQRMCGERGRRPRLKADPCVMLTVRWH